MVYTTLMRRLASLEKENKTSRMDTAGLQTGSVLNKLLLALFLAGILGGAAVKISHPAPHPQPEIALR